MAVLKPVIVILKGMTLIRMEPAILEYDGHAFHH
jgi:hypothetical protein